MSLIEKRMDHVVLVNEQDQPVGTMEKLEAHIKGVRHRAFSVLLFNEKGEYLIQQRANGKYHSSGLWSNTCCSHPRPDEAIDLAGERRLNEEIGISAKLAYAFHFEYREELDNNLVEHELDHVLVGQTESLGNMNPLEVQDMKFVSEEELLQGMESHPENYTAWFKIIMFEHLEKIKKSNKEVLV